MFQLFRNIGLAGYVLRDYIKHKINKIKKIKHLKTFDYDILDNNFSKIDRFYLRRPNLLRILIKLETILPFINNITDAEKLVGDFYCEFNNNLGNCKTVFKNTKLKDILKLASIYNNNNKTELLFDSKLLTTLEIYNNHLNKQNRLDIKNYIVNVDKDANINLRELLLYNNINVYKYNKITIIVTSFETMEEQKIETDIVNYIERNINDLIN